MFPAKPQRSLRMDQPIYISIKNRRFARLVLRRPRWVHQPLAANSAVSHVYQNCIVNTILHQKNRGAPVPPPKHQQRTPRSVQEIRRLKDDFCRRHRAQPWRGAFQSLLTTLQSHQIKVHRPQFEALCLPSALGIVDLHPRPPCFVLRNKICMRRIDLIAIMRLD